MADPTIRDGEGLGFDRLADMLQSDLDEHELAGEDLDDCVWTIHQDYCASSLDPGADDIPCTCVPVVVQMSDVKRIGVKPAGDMLEAYTGLSPSGSPDG